MKTYMEGTLQELQSPDLSAGYTYPGRIKAGTEDIVLPGSTEAFPPDGLRERKDVYQDCLFYHKYTEEDLTAQQEQPGASQTDVDKKIQAALAPVYEAIMEVL